MRTEELLKKKNVVIIFTGKKTICGVPTDRSAICVGVTTKVPLSELKRADRVPKKVQGQETDVFETEMPQALRTSKHRPAPGGCSISHFQVTAGTLGMRVKKDGFPYILSNNHVIANCLAEDTEVLTKQGWQYWSNVDMNTEFASRCLNGFLNYEKPKRLIKEYYRGPMLRFNGRWHDLLITPNHRLLAKDTYRSSSYRKDKSFRPIRAIEAFDRCQGRSTTIEMTSTMQWNCAPLADFTLPIVKYKRGKDFNRYDRIPIDPWLEFLGLFLGDGSATIRPTVDQYITQIRCVDKNQRKYIMQLSVRLGFNAFANGGSIRITNKQLTLFLAEIIGKTANKRIPREVLLAPPEQLESLWRGLMLSDGWASKNNCEGFCSKNYALASDVQELALKLGKGATIRRVDGSPYNASGVYWVIGTNHKSSFRQCEDPQILPYDGFVYCAEVGNETLMVRRNGKPCWVCNCNDAEMGDQTWQPGSAHGGGPADTIGHLSAWVPIRFQGEGSNCPVARVVITASNFFAKLLHRKTRLGATASIVNNVDCAIARPIEDEALLGTILEVGAPAGFGQAAISDEIKMSGATSGLKQGQVIATDGMTLVNYGAKGTAIFEDQIITTPIAAGGDSGSVVLNDNNEVVGLLFAGSSSLSIVNKISNVIEALGLERSL